MAKCDVSADTADPGGFSLNIGFSLFQIDLDQTNALYGLIEQQNRNQHL